MNSRLAEGRVAFLTVAALVVATARAEAEPVSVSSSPDPSTEQVMDDDVLSDRGWLTPTALPQPANTVSIATHLLPEQFLVASVGIGDRVNLTAGAAYELLDARGVAGSFGAKVTLARWQRVALAVHAGAYRIEDDMAATGGATASFCVDRRCRNLVSVNTFVAHSEHISLMVGGVSWIGRASRRVRLVLEVDVARQIRADHGRFEGQVAFAGARFTTRRWALDVGLGGLWDEGGDVGLPLPMMSLAYRFGRDPA